MKRSNKINNRVNLLSHYCIIMMFLLFSILSLGQTDSIKTYTSTNIKGVPLGKGLSITYEIQPSYDIETIDNTNLIGNSSTKIKRSNRLNIKSKFPILNKKNLLILGGLRYNFEEYHFTDNSNIFYKGLEDKGLKTIGTDFTLVKPTKTKNYWILRVKADFNGDYNSNFLNNEFLKFSVSPLWGRKVNENFTYAVGLSFNYQFGNPLILPVVSFNKNLNNKWDIESVLPAFVRLRYKKKQALNWVNSVELEGASYKINSLNTVFPSYNNIHLHRSEIRYSSKIEKRFYGWIWFSAEIGLSQNLTYNVTNSNKSNNSILLKNNVNSSSFYNFSIFIVPSKIKKI